MHVSGAVGLVDRKTSRRRTLLGNAASYEDLQCETKSCLLKNVNDERNCCGESDVKERYQTLMN